MRKNPRDSKNSPRQPPAAHSEPASWIGIHFAAAMLLVRPQPLAGMQSAGWTAPAVQRDQARSSSERRSRLAE
jgi:hypothetical protein